MIKRTVPNRLTGLSDSAVGMLQDAKRSLQHNDMARAGRSLAGAAAIAPDHPEVLRFTGLRLALMQQPAQALPWQQRSLVLRPDDGATLNELASSLYALADADADAAFDAWQRSLRSQPDNLATLLNYSSALKKSGRSKAAIEPLQHAVALAPQNLIAREMLLDALIEIGRFDEAIKGFQEILRQQETCGAAWWGLAKIKTRRLADGELEQLESVFQRSDLPERERMPMAFALGKAFEDRARYAEAFKALRIANDIAHRQRPWDARLFSQRVDALIDAAASTRTRATSPALGKEIIFIVSLPRAGSTLTEQILAAHPDVEGAGEINDLTDVLSAESRRRGMELPFWMAHATGEDWQRLGRDYLERTRRWRKSHPRMTDKLPNNWLVIGAIRAMLPGARIVNCRRDPLETCWSCYRELFARGAEYSYDFADLGAFWHDYERSLRFFAERSPAILRDQHYEALVRDPESEIRALLAFCDLAFDPACLRFHESGRHARTASASQVRQPLRPDTARAALYGELLDPLRAALSLPRAIVGEASTSMP